MEAEEESLRVPRLKRKCGGGDGGNPQPKKATAGRRRSRTRGAEPGSSSEEDSDSAPHYSVEEIKEDEFFLSATFLTCKDERGAFTTQEFYRPKKILCELRKVLLVEDQERRARGEMD
ncbi:hypothetical protein EYF80_067999 [Liparis tanakae]|uniref:Uncharacterized protein n=1 Tax=Liparis tanakae TaxID=230148 RepID=A0A4Z2E056_9TELE|nr:hypothetical protein EYF80_067999 [Liparis tanakae]